MVCLIENLKMVSELIGDSSEWEFLFALGFLFFNAPLTTFVGLKFGILDHSENFGKAIDSKQILLTLRSVLLFPAPQTYS